MRGDDVAGLGRVAAGHVLAGRDDADHVDRQPACRRARGSCRARSPAPHMSNFISSISAAGLSEMPPVSKVMPLPTSASGFLALGRAAVAQHDELGRLVRAAARPRGTSPCRASPCRAARAPRPASLNWRCELLRLLGEVGRACRRWAAGCRGAREIDAVGDGLRLGERLLELRVRAQRCSVTRCERRLRAPSSATSAGRSGRALRACRAPPGARSRSSGRPFTLASARNSAASLAPEVLQRAGARRAPRRGTRSRRTPALAQRRPAARARRRCRAASAAAASSRSCRQVAERLAQRAARGLVDALRRRRELLAGVHAEDDAGSSSRSRARCVFMLNSTSESIA